jgi:hypothetical protein
VISVLIHSGTQNLGDAIQTVALCQVLGCQCWGVYRDSIDSAVSDDLLIANGWLGHGPPRLGFRNVIFAGVHLGLRVDEYLEWMRGSGRDIGARDPYTLEILGNAGISSQLVGCATLALNRYRGARRNSYSVDVPQRPGTIPLTNGIGPMSWEQQWNFACARLDQLRQAELVYTNRLHIALPCLAFGTPVVFPSSELKNAMWPGRLTLLEAIGFPFDEAVEMDVSAHRDRYIGFLEKHADLKLTPSDAALPPIPQGRP